MQPRRGLPSFARKKALYRVCEQNSLGPNEEKLLEAPDQSWFEPFPASFNLAGSQSPAGTDESSSLSHSL
jgi:hypothetical protein